MDQGNLHGAVAPEGSLGLEGHVNVTRGHGRGHNEAGGNDVLLVAHDELGAELLLGAAGVQAHAGHEVFVAVDGEGDADSSLVGRAALADLAARQALHSHLCGPRRATPR